MSIERSIEDALADLADSAFLDSYSPVDPSKPAEEHQTTGPEPARTEPSPKAILPAQDMAEDTPDTARIDYMLEEMADIHAKMDVEVRTIAENLEQCRPGGVDGFKEVMGPQTLTQRQPAAEGGLPQGKHTGGPYSDDCPPLGMQSGVEIPPDAQQSFVSENIPNERGRKSPKSGSFPKDEFKGVAIANSDEVGHGPFRKDVTLKGVGDELSGTKLSVKKDNHRPSKADTGGQDAQKSPKKKVTFEESNQDPREQATHWSHQEDKEPHQDPGDEALEEAAASRARSGFPGIQLTQANLDQANRTIGRFALRQRGSLSSSESSSSSSTSSSRGGTFGSDGPIKEESRKKPFSKTAEAVYARCKSRNEAVKYRLAEMSRVLDEQQESIIIAEEHNENLSEMVTKLEMRQSLQASKGFEVRLIATLAERLGMPTSQANPFPTTVIIAVLVIIVLAMNLGGAARQEHAPTLGGYVDGGFTLYSTRASFRSYVAIVGCCVGFVLLGSGISSYFQRKTAGEDKDAQKPPISRKGSSARMRP